MKLQVRMSTIGIFGRDDDVVVADDYCRCSCGCDGAMMMAMREDGDGKR